MSRKFYTQGDWDEDEEDDIAVPVDEIDLVEDIIPERYRGRVKASPVALAEQLNGPWTGNNNIGYETDFAPDTNNRQVVIKLPEWGMPASWTLMLGLDYTRAYWPMAAPYSYFEMKADLTVGSGGTTQQIRVDWKRGTTITLPMNALSVHAVYDFPAGSPSFPPNLRLRTTLARGVAQKPWQATYSARLEDSSTYPSGNAQTLFTPIPAFAQKVLLFPENLNVAPVGNLLYSSDTIIGFGTGAGGTAFYMIYYITGDLLAGYANGLPIPSGAETLIVYNPAGADQVRSHAVFELVG